LRRKDEEINPDEIQLSMKVVKGSDEYNEEEIIF